MTREIKFRAWYKPKRMMCEVSKIDFNEGEVECWVGEPRGDIWIAKLSDVELMQYTGLKDKNGIEIYEGDVLHFEKDDFSYNIVIGCADGSFTVQVSESVRIRMHMERLVEPIGEYDLTEFSVIGNVFENPERLTKEM